MRIKIVAGFILAVLCLCGSGTAAPVPGGLLNIKAGAFVLGDNVPFFNKTAGPGDLVAVRPQNLFLLQEIMSGRKTVVVGLRDLPHARAILTQAKNLGATTVGLSLEGNPARPISQDLLAKAVAFARAAKNAGFGFVLIPRPGEQGFRLQPWLRLVDDVILPAQGIQAKDDFGQIVGGIVARIKTAAPTVKVWVQVTVNPPRDGTLTAEAVLAKIAEISSLADGIFIAYAPKNWPTAKTVILSLKNITAPAE